MSDAWLESCGLKKRKSTADVLPPEASALSRLDLFEDLLEEDTSVFPLLDVPPEVLTTIGIFLDADHLAALSQLNARAEVQFGDALGDAWAELLLRDYAFQSRAKRYQYRAVAGEAQHTQNQSAGRVLEAVDLSRIEWDGMLVAAPFHLRYRFLQTLGALKSRWGRMAQSWEWFSTRVMHRMTHEQMERLVPGYSRQGKVAEEFDEVSHQETMDRDRRQRHRECNPKDVIASMKRSLGIADEAGGSAEKGESRDAPSAAGGDGSMAEGAIASSGTSEATPGCPTGDEDILSALAPTARDQRMQQAQLEAEKIAAAAAGPRSDRAAGATTLPDAPFYMPPQEVVERMSFAEQMDLAMKVSQTSGDSDKQKAEESRVTSVSQQVSRTDSGTSIPSTTAAAESAAPVILRLKASRHGREEALEVVVQDLTVGEKMGIPEVLRRGLEQVTLRLARGDWLLLYESIDKEASLRARAIAHHCRATWLPRGSAPVRSCVDLEAELLQLPIFGRKRAAEAGKLASDISSDLICTGSGPAVLESVAQEEMQLRAFLRAWEEHEAWAMALEEHLGPLDLEIGRERANNMQHGRAHTPYAADLCRLAFRNFAICEARLFFALALAVYNLIARLVKGASDSPEGSADHGTDLLEGLCAMAEIYSVQDDALATQRNTLQEYRYYLLEPLQRARAQVLPAHELGAVEDEEDDYV